MDFKKLGGYVIIVGILVIAYGLYGLNQSNVDYNRNSSRITGYSITAGRQRATADLIYKADEANALKKMGVGGLIVIVGIGMRRSAKKEQFK